MVFNWNSLITSYILPLLVRSIAKFGRDFDFEKFKITVGDRIPKLIPGEAWDAAAVSFANSLVDVLANALQNTTGLETLINLCISKDFLGALRALYALVVDEKV